MRLALALLLAVATGPTPAPPRVTVRLAPRIAQAPARVQLIARVADDRRELRCPTFEIVWGDGCRSESEGECDPYGPQDERPTGYALVPPPHRYYLGGDYTLTVRVKGQDEAIEGSARLVVVGPEPLSTVREPR